MTEKKPDKSRISLNSQQPVGGQRSQQPFDRISAPGASQQPPGKSPTGNLAPPPKPKK